MASKRALGKVQEAQEVDLIDDEQEAAPAKPTGRSVAVGKGLGKLLAQSNGLIAFEKGAYLFLPRVMIDGEPGAKASSTGKTMVVYTSGGNQAMDGGPLGVVKGGGNVFA